LHDPQAYIAAVLGTDRATIPREHRP